MKTIQMSDEDYKTLMELSKELQTQQHDSQAFPRFWSPRSTKYEIGTGDDEKGFYFDGEFETSQELFNDDDLRKKYLKNEEMKAETDFSGIDLYSWEKFLEEEGYTMAYRRETEVLDNNFSLFKSDVKKYIRLNKHHLGKAPHTYANTIFRMHKMEKLIKCLYRLNPMEKNS